MELNINQVIQYIVYIGIQIIIMRLTVSLIFFILYIDVNSR